VVKLSLQIYAVSDASQICFDESASTFVAFSDSIQSLRREQMDGGIERLIIEWS
jgi:hypothetical protein